MAGLRRCLTAPGSAALDKPGIGEIPLGADLGWSRPSSARPLSDTSSGGDLARGSLPPFFFFSESYHPLASHTSCPTLGRRMDLLGQRWASGTPPTPAGFSVRDPEARCPVTSSLAQRENPQSLKEAAGWGSMPACMWGPRGASQQRRARMHSEPLLTPPLHLRRKRVARVCELRPEDL